MTFEVMAVVIGEKRKLEKKENWCKKKIGEKRELVKKENFL